MYGSNSDVDSKGFITRRWTKIRSDDVRKLFFTTVMGKILHFLMDESIEEEQKKNRNLYTVFEKNLEDHFRRSNVKR